MSTAEEYQAKADDALAKLGEAKSDAERLRLRRAHSAYSKLASHGAEAAARAALKPAPRITPEKPVAGKQAKPLDSFTLK